MQFVPENPLIAIFQLSSAVSLNLGRSQNGLSGNGLRNGLSDLFPWKLDSTGIYWWFLREYTSCHMFIIDIMCDVILMGRYPTEVKFLKITKIFINWLTFYRTIVNEPKEGKSFENMLEKGENAGHQHFLLCPTFFFFLPYQRRFPSSNILPHKTRLLTTL